MRIAILSDIHGNLPALSAVLDDAVQHRVTVFWCLGDVVGYGPWPVQCWSVLEKLDISSDAWVVGNHDLELVDGLEGGQYFQGEYFHGEAKTVLEHHRQLCQSASPELMQQIGQIKAIAQPLPGVILAHGVPKPQDKTWTVTKVTTSKIDAEQALTDLLQAGLRPKLIVVGHSHRTLFWQRAAGPNALEAVWHEEMPYGELGLGNMQAQPVYLNPGSVGQPRDDGPEASYCILDWEKKSVYFRRVAYPLEFTRQKMRELGYPSALIERWYVG